MNKQNYILYSDLRQVLGFIYNYLVNSNSEKNIENLKKCQDLIKLAKEIDFSIATHDEQTFGTQIEEQHGPKRLAIFLLNYYGEMALNNTELTIIDDDPIYAKIKNYHDNTYGLKLKDIDSHTGLYKGLPAKDSKPYDFDTEFLTQITKYPDGIVDTTKTAWDSYHNRYQVPHRTLDFKSALWTSGKNTHNVNYIIKLDKDKEFKLFKTSIVDGKINLDENKFNLKTMSTTPEYIERYFKLLNCLQMFNNTKWDTFILNEVPTEISAVEVENE